jgi:thioredoxin-like negative regulator of GroEL
MLKVTEEQTFLQLVAEPGITVAVFKTTWCRDCHYIEPFMPEIVQAYDGRIKWLEIDRDDLPDLCERLNILGIPSFVAFHGGQETVRFVSKLRKSREEIEQFLERAIAVSNALT